MSSTSGMLLVALALGGAYMIANANRPSVFRSAEGIVATSTNGIVATNFIKTNLDAATLQGIAWSRSNGSYDDSDPNSYGQKLREIYDETYGKGKW